MSSIQSSPLARSRPAQQPDGSLTTPPAGPSVDRALSSRKSHGRETPLEHLARGLASTARCVGELPRQVRSVVERVEAGAPREHVRDALLGLEMGAKTADPNAVVEAVQAMGNADLQTLLRHLQITLTR
jgi:hypothetical protein